MFDLSNLTSTEDKMAALADWPIVTPSAIDLAMNCKIGGDLGLSRKMIERQGANPAEAVKIMAQIEWIDDNADWLAWAADVSNNIASESKDGSPVL